jgi:hypothetical protein
MQTISIYPDIGSRLMCVLTTAEHAKDQYLAILCKMKNPAILRRALTHHAVISSYHTL